MKNYKIEKYSGEATFKFYFPEYFEEDTPDSIDYEKVYELFKSMLTGNDLDNFLESFEEGQEGWFWQTSIAGHIYYVWGDGPGYNDLICIEETNHEIKTITDLEIGDYATQNNEVAEVKGLYGSQYKYYANTDREYVPENAEINEVNDLFVDYVND